MSLIKRNSSRDLAFWNREYPAFRGMQTLQHDMNRIVDEFFRGDLLTDDSFFIRDWNPAVDIVENSDQCILKAEIPGLTKDDVKITLENNVITIRGEKKNEVETKEGEYHRIERKYGSFERSFTVPESIKMNEIDAQYKDGVLILTMPKAEETKPKSVEIKVR
ncbi:MAG: Hsp20/alpha crystallin family protein [Bacteriovoracaceae bacterium]